MFHKGAARWRPSRPATNRSERAERAGLIPGCAPWQVTCQARSLLDRRKFGDQPLGLHRASRADQDFQGFAWPACGPARKAKGKSKSGLPAGLRHATLAVFIRSTRSSRSGILLSCDEAPRSIALRQSFESDTFGKIKLSPIVTAVDVLIRGSAPGAPARAVERSISRSAMREHRGQFHGAGAHQT